MPVSEPQVSSPDTPPRTVVRAVWLLWISLAVGIVELALSMNPFRKPVDVTTDAHRMTVLGVFISIAFIGAAYLWIVQNVRKGHNWARFTVLVLVVLGVIQSLMSRHSLEPVPFLLNLVEMLLDITALALLFKEPGAHWFNRVHR